MNLAASPSNAANLIPRIRVMAETWLSKTTQLTREASGAWTWSGEKEASLLLGKVYRGLDHGCLLQ